MALFYLQLCSVRSFNFYFPASRYGAVLLPSSPGALHDLAKDNELAKLLNAFVQEKSEFQCYCMLFEYNDFDFISNSSKNWPLS